jgi:hypothetical protein
MRRGFKLSLAAGAMALGLVAAKSSQAAVTNPGFEGSPDFTGWNTTGNTTIQASDFRVPVEGTVAALLYTGNGAVTGGSNPVTASALDTFLGLSGANSAVGQGGTQGSAIQQTSISVAAGQVITFSYDFTTQEPAVGGNNDFAYLEVNGANFTKLATVAGSTFGAPPATVLSGPLAGNNAGINSLAGIRETGYKSFSITFTNAGTYSIGFGVVDVGAAGGPSGLLLDNFAQVNGPTAIPGIVIGGGGGSGVPLPAGMYLLPLGLAVASLYSLKLRRAATC